MSKKLFRKFMCVLLAAVLALNPLDTKAIASDYAPTYTVTTEAAPALGGLGVSLGGIFGSIAVGVGVGGATVAADAMRDAQQQEARRDPETGREYKKPKSGSHKEKADNAPSWAFGERPYVDENGKEFAKRVMDKRYGKDKWYKGPKSKGPDSEYNKIRKWGDRAFE